MDSSVQTNAAWPAFSSMAEDIIEIAGTFAAQGMLPATSGNFSARLDQNAVAITMSGKDKGRLQPADIMVTGLDGQAIEPAGARPSAETLIHTYLYRVLPEVHYIAHSHSMAAATVSYRNSAAGFVTLPPFELLKALEGTTTHETEIRLPVFANDQNIERLVGVIEDSYGTSLPRYGFLLAGHGLYTWGETKEQVLRHGEAIDFLLTAALHL